MKETKQQQQKERRKKKKKRNWKELIKNSLDRDGESEWGVCRYKQISKYALYIDIYIYIYLPYLYV